ncbi:MAG: hypothetical protein QF878_07485 [SAR202 cluster bacterium]|nr:hypothetical protein [SAR202 cluster bacterium]MDP6715608.1 hypothetical protein [SAR202 cluster bacterium]
MRRLIDVEILIIVVVRGTTGLLSSTVISLMFWWGTRAFLKLNASDLGQDVYFLTQAVIFGASATLVIALSWWNTQSPPRLQWLFAVLTLGITILSAWLFNEIRGIETHYALVGGVLRVEVFSIRHMVSSMMMGAVIGGNIFAASLYLYRVTRYNEV